MKGMRYKDANKGGYHELGSTTDILLGRQIRLN